MNLQNKVCLITGASSGIGLALARLFVDKGAKVALLARTASKLTAAVAELGAERAAAFPADVLDRPALDRVLHDVVARFGSLDILINNAGTNYRGPALTRTAEEMVQTLETNLVSVVYLTRRALDLIPRGGAIINIASLAGKVPYSTQTSYCASKAGLRFFSLALHEELAPQDIHVLCVNPGPVDTEFFGDASQVADLTFSQPMSTVEEVAAVTLEGLLHKRAEVDLPMLSGKLTTLGYLSPGLKAALRPFLERIGKKNKAAYLRRRGIG